MECFCGCGTKVPRKLTDANLRLGEMALELLAWDKHRATSDQNLAEVVETDRLIDQGAGAYRRLLSALHGDHDGASLDASDEWLRESRTRWRNRADMVEKGSLLRGPKLRLTSDDLDRLDRKQPELSFSAHAAPRTSRSDRHEPDPDRAAEDPVAQLKGLRELHRAGALTDEEFRAAKARVIARM